MEANQILDADILDIIFEGRNKSYGAYDLRKTYNKRFVRAMVIAGSIILLLFLGTVVANMINKRMSEKDLDVLETQMAEIKNEPPPPPPPPTPPPPPPPPEVNQVKFTPPVVKKDEEVKQDEKPPEIKDETTISTKTVESENTAPVVSAPIVDEGSKVVEPPVNDNQIFTKVEVEAAFPGGDGAWRRYLTNNLDANVPIENNADPGTYTVVVRFIVSKDGSVSDVTAETKQGHGMEEEAVKIIKKGPKWTPAIQNGRNVNAYRRQPITFIVNEQ